MKHEFAILALALPGLLLVIWVRLHFFVSLAPSIARLMAVLGG